MSIAVAVAVCGATAAAGPTGAIAAPSALSWRDACCNDRCAFMSMLKALPAAGAFLTKLGVVRAELFFANSVFLGTFSFLACRTDWGAGASLL
eukprot:886258-Pleurochrysis_carterae.AAC.5